MKKILLVGPYPPLFSYGGPTKSIYGLKKCLSKNFDCYVLSPNRNLDGTLNKNLKNVKSIFYKSSSSKFLLLNAHKYDIIWFNSFFEHRLILLILMSLTLKFKLIISPRGQLANNAINTSNIILKKLFIKIIKPFKSNFIFHSTSESESNDIIEKFQKVRIKELPNIFSLNFIRNNSYEKNYLFYSRIHKKKGLNFLLKTLNNCSLNIKLDIYGFIEDHEYWNECKKNMKNLNHVNYKGEIKNGNISMLADKYTFFILPTLNENYGHVIIELLSLGIIPIISKKTTPFDSLLDKGIGFNFDLTSSNELEKIINKTKKLSIDELSNLKTNVSSVFQLLKHDLESITKEYINFVNHTK
tara:strand:+ start:2558 stop:3625 length:1068 start_codon:yes stop_codon:yes gene_type:complete